MGAVGGRGVMGVFLGVVSTVVSGAPCAQRTRHCRQGVAWVAWGMSGKGKGVLGPCESSNYGCHSSASISIVCLTLSVMFGIDLNAFKCGIAPTTTGLSKYALIHPSLGDVRGPAAGTDCGGECSSG